MKRFLLVLTLATVAGATYVATAPGGQAAGPTAAQFNALKKQVAKLQGSVSALHATVVALDGVVEDDDAFIANCFVAEGVAPVSQYGDGVSGAYGYAYSNDGSDYFLTTGLDFTSSGDSVDVYLQAVSPSCLAGPLRKGGDGRRFEHRMALTSGKH